MIDIKNIFSDVKYLHLIGMKMTEGFFQKSIKEREFRKVGIENQFCSKISFSKKGIPSEECIFKKPFAQSKMIKVLKGSIFDVFIDLRKTPRIFKVLAIII